MRLTKLFLQNFRSFKKAAWNFSDKTVIVGENGAGKSNIMEVVYLGATGKSFRAEREAEMIIYGENFSILNYSFDYAQDKQITNMQVSIVDGRKKFEVNGVAKKMIDFAGRMKAVLFGPADMELVTGTPGIRRRYLDFVLSQADREYRRSLVSYEKGVRQRNKILQSIRDTGADRNQLWFWDRLLIKDGNVITDKREKYIDFLNRRDGQYEVEYDKSVISEQRLAQYKNEEVAAAVTLVGPHRDDFVIEKLLISKTSPLTPLLNSSLSACASRAGEGNYKDVSKFGSRGEQRMGVLWLKMGERDFLTGEDGLPILLLDDIFSELDEKHREEVMKLVGDQVKRGGQVIMTTADRHLSPTGAGWHVLELEQGR